MLQPSQVTMISFDWITRDLSCKFRPSRSFVMHHTITTPFLLSPNRRSEITTELRSASPAVMALLVSCVEKPEVNAALLTRVYKCLGSWVNLGAVNSQELANSVLLYKAFQSLAAPDTPSSLHEAITGRIFNRKNSFRASSRICWVHPVVRPSVVIIVDFINLISHSICPYNSICTPFPRGANIR